MPEEKQIKPKTTQPKKVELTKKTNRQRFLDNAEFRATKVIERLQILGKIFDNPQNYEYGEEDILKVFTPIEAMTEEVKNKALSTLKVENLAEKHKVNLS